MKKITFSLCKIWILSALMMVLSGHCQAGLTTYLTDNSNPLLLRSEYYQVQVGQGDQREALIVYMSRSNGSVENVRNRPVDKDSISWAHFSMSEPVTLEVTLAQPLPDVDVSETIQVLPSRKRVSVERLSATTVRFILFEPGQYSVEFGAKGYKNGLLIFADPPETSVPDSEAANVYACNNCDPVTLSKLPEHIDTVSFGAGLHKIENWYPTGQIKNIYLDGNAMVQGAIHFEQASNSGTKVYGRGHLDGRIFGGGTDKSRKFHMVEAAPSVRDIWVEGIIISQPSAFAVRLLGEDNNIHWVKTPGGWRFNNDGLVGYKNTRISHSFVWANDDAIKLYRDNQDIRDVVIWQLTNGASFQWAWHAVENSNVRVQRVDVLHGEWPHDGRNQGVFNLRGQSRRGAVKVQQDFVFEDIRVETPVRVLVNLKPNDIPHIIRDVTFRNISFKSHPDMINRIEGYDEQHKISRILFDNVRMDGECLSKEAAISKANFHFKHAEQIEFRCPEGVISEKAFGYDNVITLFNDSTRVSITPDFAGKIMSYSFQGNEFLKPDSSDYGWQMPDDGVDAEEQKLIFNGAGRFDVGHTWIHNRRDWLFFGPWQAEVLGDRHVRVTSRYDVFRGLRVWRDYRLAESGSKLSIQHYMRNESGEVQKAHFWTRTFAQGGGVFAIPLTPASFYPQQYAVKQDMLLNLAPPEDRQVIKLKEALFVIGQPAFEKFGFDSYAGRHAYWAPNGLQFWGQYPTFPEAQYADVMSGVYSLFYNNDYHGRSVAELEPVSPQYVLAPGESASFWENWQLEYQAFPVEPAAVHGKMLLDKFLQMEGR